MTPEDRRRALEQIAQEVGKCTSCRLHQTRTNAVPGEGHPDTEVVFVGEGPGFNEDQQGRPFVGAAGNLLTELLRSIGWRRDDVYITNVVKCRPPGNRDPEADEIAACRPYLRRQLDVLDPALLVTLGRISTGTILPGTRIGGAHGTIRPIAPDSDAPNALAYPMYHPAAAFRQGGLKETLQADMAGLPEALIESRRRRGGTDGQPAEPMEPVAVGVESAVRVESAVQAAVPVDSAVRVAIPVESAGPVESAVRVESVERVEQAPDPNQLNLF